MFTNTHFAATRVVDFVDFPVRSTSSEQLSCGGSALSEPATSARLKAAAALSTTVLVTLLLMHPSPLPGDITLTLTQPTILQLITKWDRKSVSGPFRNEYNYNCYVGLSKLTFANY